MQNKSVLSATYMCRWSASAVTLSGAKVPSNKVKSKCTIYFANWTHI